MTDIKAHLFPFSVDKEGSINSKQYFKIEKDGDVLETVMLGRKLVGHPVTVPTTIEGRVWEKFNEEEYEEEEEQTENTPWTKTNKTINEFILWKKDTAPDVKDPRINALNRWIEISEAMNEPIPLPNPK